MKTLTEDYVSYEIAQLLKEKGVDFIDCVTYYCEDKPKEVNYSFCGETNSTWEKRCCQAPTHQMVLKWLREVHKLHIFAKPYWPQGDMRNKMSWQGFIVDLNTINGDSQCYADSFEEVIENRIKFALENLI